MVQYKVPEYLEQKIELCKECVMFENDQLKRNERINLIEVID